MELALSIHPWHEMKCEICDVATATMWVQPPPVLLLGKLWKAKKIPSCDDCGPQAGYKILAPLEPVPTLRQ